MIRQAHYTSVARGPSGLSGFQFCAWSEGLDDRILRTVERLTTYHRPREVHGDADISSFPVNLVYTALDAGDLKLIARVQYTGEDFSQRAGNYFAHSLIVDAVPADLGSPFPAELWAAPIWRSEPGTSRQLPALRPPPPDGSVRLELHAVLQRAGAYDERLAWLTAAAEAAINGGSQVLLAGPTDEVIWQWILAASYLLGPHIAPRLSFCTYGHDPTRTGTHLIGVTSPRPAALAAGAEFAVLDLSAAGDEERRPPTASPSAIDAPTLACASMLTSVGVVAAEAAWRDAITLGRPTSGRLGHWYPVLACALISAGARLAPADIAVAIDWLAEAGLERTRHAALVQGFTRQQLGELSLGHQARLIQDAFRLDGGFGAGRPELAVLIEQALVAQTLARLTQPTAEPAVVRLRTRTGAELATQQCDRQLRSRSSARHRLAVLRWASLAGVDADDDLVTALGAEIMGLALVEDGWSVDLIGPVARDWPAFRAGMVSRLATEPEAVVDAAQGYLLAEIFEAADFASAQRLGDRWVSIRAAARHASPVEEFIQTCELRRLTHAPGLTDTDLLWRLWPSGSWTVADAMAVAGAFPLDEVLDSEPVLTAIADAFRSGPPADAGRRLWTELAVYITHWPADLINAYGVEDARAVKALRNVVDAITDPVPGTPRMAHISRLMDSYPKAPPVAQAYLAAEIPELILVHHPRPHLALASCPQPVLFTFCALSREQLVANPHNARLAARLFFARRMLMSTHKDKRPALAIEGQALAPMVDVWTRRDIAAIARELNQMQAHEQDARRVAGDRSSHRADEFTEKAGDEFTRWVRDRRRTQEQAKKAKY
jgi:GTPase-associated protein 1, N-terminal domain type 2/GTPase-associated protein 1, C-terminal domain/GTPase-associated protein 1, middle domain